MQFTVGKNVTRIRDQQIYTPEDFERDLHSMDGNTTACVINLINSKAAPLFSGTKCITSNFLRCAFDPDILDPWYFCYQFNVGMEQKINILHQGTASVKKLNIKSVSELQIPFPDIMRQRQIGALYRKAMVQKKLMILQAENIEKMILEVLKKLEED